MTEKLKVKSISADGGFRQTDTSPYLVVNLSPSIAMDRGAYHCVGSAIGHFLDLDGSKWWVRTTDQFLEDTDHREITDSTLVSVSFYLQRSFSKDFVPSLEQIAIEIDPIIEDIPGFIDEYLEFRKNIKESMEGKGFNYRIGSDNVKVWLNDEYRAYYQLPMKRGELVGRRRRKIDFGPWKTEDIMESLLKKETDNKAMRERNNQTNDTYEKQKRSKAAKDAQKTKKANAEFEKLKAQVEEWKP